MILLLLIMQLLEVNKSIFYYGGELVVLFDQYLTSFC